MDRNRWLAHEGDALLTWLHESEEKAKRAIFGIGHFIVRKIPELFRQWLELLNVKLIYAARVATRVSRVAGLLAALVLIVFGPLAIYPGILTGAWSVVTIVGSWWGLSRQIRRQQVTVTTVKAVQHG
jgi:hypothetical protein